VQSPSWGQDQKTMSGEGTHLDRKIRLLLDVENTINIYIYILSQDVQAYHRVSDRYYATDRQLTTFLAALIHPDTKGARKRVSALLQEMNGWTGFLHPIDHRTHKTLCETVLNIH
jgi:hypothetical protein